MSQEPYQPQTRASLCILKPDRLPECGPHLEQAELCEHWFWDGDFGHVLGCIQGQEERWLVEKGVMRREDGWHDGAKDLLVGDVVYRARTLAGQEMGEDPREDLFDWFYVDAGTGAEQPRSEWYDQRALQPEFVTVAQLFGRGGRKGDGIEPEPEPEPD